MTFKEFYQPIAKLDSAGKGTTNEAVFVKAMNFFKFNGELKNMLRKNLSFWFAMVFISAGFVYVANEVLLGERVHSSTDVSWRLGEFFVWNGFFLGMIGYFRIYLKTIERECNDNRDQIHGFRRAVLSENSLEDEHKRKPGDDSDDDAGGGDDVLFKSLNPFAATKGAFQTSMSVALGSVEIAGKMAEKTATVSAKVSDKALSSAGVTQPGQLNNAMNMGIGITKGGTNVGAAFLGLNKMAGREEVIPKTAEEQMMATVQPTGLTNLISVSPGGGLVVSQQSPTPPPPPPAPTIPGGDGQAVPAPVFPGPDGTMMTLMMGPGGVPMIVPVGSGSMICHDRGINNTRENFFGFL